MRSSVNTTPSQSGMDPPLRNLSLPVGTLEVISLLTVVSLTPPSSSSGSPLGSNRKGTNPQPPNTLDGTAFPNQSRVKSSSFPHSEVAGSSYGTCPARWPLASRSAGGARPLSALCWQDWSSHTHLEDTAPQQGSPFKSPLPP